MKEGTVEVVIKGACYFAVGGLAPLASSLGQWVNSGDWPPRIAWVVILSGCITGAFTQLLSYMSGSYASYKAKGNGNGAPLPPVTITPIVKP